MTDRGLPIVDGAQACPFVAFADDRDERATSPDHRHRCYAEMRPAPRALAHQEAYCLASAFPVCPTFQDWARREAARARPGAADAASAAAPGRSQPETRPGPDPLLGAAAAGGAVGQDVAAPGFLASRDRAGGGLAGSRADRMVSEGSGSEGGTDDLDDAEPPAAGAAAAAVVGAAGSAPGFLGSGASGDPPGAGRRNAGEWLDDEVERQDAGWPAGRREAPAQRPGPVASADRRPPVATQRPRREPNPAPPLDRGRRESYPTRRTRIAVPAMTGVTIAVIVLAIAALVLFLAPGFIRNLGAGDAGRSQAPGASPTAATGASPSASASPSSTPTPSLYVVQSGDTLSDIAERFGISLVALREANAERLPDPNNLQIGDELIIPPAGTTPRPSGSASSSGSPLP